MGTAEHKQLLQHLFAEASQGNVEPFLDSLAEDVRWTVTGTTKFSRTFAGKPAVLNDLLGPPELPETLPKVISTLRA
jgi:uncharacterized protein